MNRTKLEITVGLFVLVGLFILTSIVFGVSGAYFVRPGYKVNVMFNMVNGVNPGSQVRLCGVRVGEIKSMEVVFDHTMTNPKVKVTIFVLAETQLRENYKFRLQGLYGMQEGFIQISPTGDEKSPLLKDGSVVTGEDPVFMEDVVARAKGVAANLEQSVTCVKNILERLDKGEGTMGKLLRDDTLYNEATDFVKELRARPWRLMKRDEKLPVSEEKEAEMKSLK
ncbi:MAG: MlaD family protein [Candidatus Omnitrophica bacterium]|nr:MlaD family protein [Candidatus Omnitrophota bacterium]